MSTFLYKNYVFNNLRILLSNLYSLDSDFFFPTQIAQTPVSKIKEWFFWDSAS